MEYVKNFSKKVEELTKTLIADKEVTGTGSEFVDKINPHVDQLALVGSFIKPTYDLTLAGNEESALKFQDPAIIKAYIKLNKTKGVGVSVNYDDILGASNSEEASDQLASKIVENTYKSQNIERLNILNELVNSSVEKFDKVEYTHGLINFVVSLINTLIDLKIPNDKVLAKKDTNLQDLNFKATIHDPVLFIKPEILAEIKSTSPVDIDKSFLNDFRIIPFNFVNNKITALLCDGELFKLYESYEKMGTIENPKFNFINYFLNRKITGVVNPFLCATYFLTKDK